MKLTETVTFEREVPVHIADLVHFARSVMGLGLDDEEMVKRARAFYEEQHGED